MTTTAPEPQRQSGGADRLAPERLAGRNNLLQLIDLRWLAVLGQLATILLVHFIMEVPLPLREMLSLLAVLGLFNVASRMRCLLALPVRNSELFAALLVDITVLTGQLYLSGGITNPFIFLYLLQVAVGSVLLRPRYLWAVVVVTGIGFAALTQWYRPVALRGVGPESLPTEYVLGLLGCFLLNASLFVVFIGRIQQNLRRRDASLAQLRQRAAEEEHIVRMGLLASGAAHELGTPLATMSVILGDWARIAPFTTDAELRQELQEMQRQIARCKGIVTGILTSAGESRAIAPMQTTLHRFLDKLVGEWQRSRPGSTLEYQRQGVADVAIISDTALQQMIGNVLDNGHEAAPNQPLRLTVSRDGEMLVIRVRDRGPGFAPQMLERLGSPYRSSKGKPGRGLGLFLAVNVARTLGGRVHAHNPEGGGAEVVITLPLAALMPQGSASHGP